VLKFNIIQAKILVGLSGTVQLFVQIMDFLGASVPENVKTFLNIATIVLLLLSTLIYIETSWERLELIESKLERYAEASAQSFESMESKLNQSQEVTDCTTVMRLIQGLIETPEREVTSPVRIAAGHTLKGLSTGPMRRHAEGFSRLGDPGQNEGMELKEYPLVDTFHFHLIKWLPRGSVWLGITRLDEPSAWEHVSGNKDYLNFEEELEERTGKRGNLTVLRIFCLGSEDKAVAMRGIMLGQLKARVHVRKLVERNSIDPPDMAVIWAPKNGVNSRPLQVPSTGNVGQFFEQFKQTYVPVCALNVTPRNGRELDRVTVYAPQDYGEKFEELQEIFEKTWQRAVPHEISL
jgi:hypothetical protein